MKTIKDTPGRDKETSKAHKVVFNQMINDITSYERLGFLHIPHLSAIPLEM